MVSISAFVKFFALSALAVNVVSAGGDRDRGDQPVRCGRSGFNKDYCKGGSAYFWPEKYCSGDDCAQMCCTWGACIPDGPECDGSRYHCTCEPGYPTRRNLRSEDIMLPTLLVQGIEA